MGTPEKKNLWGLLNAIPTFSFAYQINPNKHFKHFQYVRTWVTKIGCGLDLLKKTKKTKEKGYRASETVVYNMDTASH